MKFRTPVRRKETDMLTVFAIAAVYGLYRVAVAAIASLRELPRSNEDMVFF